MLQSKFVTVTFKKILSILCISTNRNKMLVIYVSLFVQKKLQLEPYLFKKYF